MLADVTRRGVDCRLAMVVENFVHSAPVINEPIPGGQMRLSTGMLQGYQERFNDVRELTTMLRAQSAPLELKLEEVHRDEERSGE